MDEVTYEGMGVSGVELECGQLFDGSSGVGGDDGYWFGSTFNNSADGCFIGVGAAGDIVHSFARIPSVTVPQGATIESGYMEPWTVSVGHDGVGTKTNIYLNDEDDAVAPTTAAEADALNLTAAFTAWDDQDFAEGRTQSPDLTDEFQEIVDRAGWASGNAMMFVWKDDGSTTGFYHKCSTIEYSSPRPFNLHIQYCA